MRRIESPHSEQIAVNGCQLSCNCPDLVDVGNGLPECRCQLVDRTCSVVALYQGVVDRRAQVPETSHDCRLVDKVGGLGRLADSLYVFHCILRVGGQLFRCLETASCIRVVLEAVEKALYGFDDLLVSHRIVARESNDSSYAGVFCLFYDWHCLCLFFIQNFFHFLAFLISEQDGQPFGGIDKREDVDVVVSFLCGQEQFHFSRNALRPHVCH